MPSAKTLVALVFLLLAAPGSAWAGLNVYRADGPAPTLQIEEPKPLEYKVQKGDSVAAIAKKFSITSKDLMAANGLADAKKLKAGQTLKIPGKTAPAPVAKAAAPAAAPVAAAAPAAKAVPSKPEPMPMEAKADASAKKASKRGEVLDPGVDESAPIKGKKGKKGKFEPAPAPAPTIEVDDKMRASFGKTGVITNSSNVPQNIRDEFLAYARKWVDELDRLGVGTATHKKIRQVGDHWEATYRVIIRESLGAEVKKVDYDHTPYVGHITYMQRVYTCEAPTKQAALAGPFTSKDEAIREIFSYSGQKKAWR
ncbi:LysM domain-containing protein [Solidesulfovibrio sp.]|jgi:LysM repeat protein|uniref:LysM peptidoglycan-binding domain-containing protein n=1 Tax=Solidesulfovibrio sp. TaxID=2910990 RepID=UPI000EEF5F3B|nr:LysM domain-containing protein [Solidesulfovibrio sp.]MEA5090045.1 LysM domain-containing protein [Solidesulfovibrio sp.]HCR13268.1 peptidoglycan-binding protein [Desulfovibrio sp.]HML60539.1 LysM domain-containing protein [Solidesulfovibrio sp.]